MGFAYTSATTLNDLQTREAARQPKTQAMAIDGLVQETIPNPMAQQRNIHADLTAKPDKDRRNL